MATLKDVANLAQVSLTTASIVASGRGELKRISPATIQRVYEAIEQVHYQPNQNARLLRAKSARSPVLAFYWPLDFRVNILGRRLSNLYGVLLEQDLDYEIVVQTYFNGHLEDRLAPLITGRYSGAIIAGASDADSLQLEAASLVTPVVLMNTDSQRYSTVGISHEQMGLQVASLLHKKGYEECAIVKSAELHRGTAKRTKAFLYACAQLGISVLPQWSFSGPATITGGAQATLEYCALTKRPKALYYEKDCMAQGGLYTLLRCGVAVPGDVELLSLGMQEPETMQYLTPSISCVSVPPNVDKQAMAVLLELLEHPPADPIHVELEPLVQLRESFTLPAPS